MCKSHKTFVAFWRTTHLQQLQLPGLSLHRQCLQEVRIRIWIFHPFGKPTSGSLSYFWVHPLFADDVCLRHGKVKERHHHHYQHYCPHKYHRHQHHHYHHHHHHHHHDNHFQTFKLLRLRPSALLSGNLHLIFSADTRWSHSRWYNLDNHLHHHLDHLQTLCKPSTKLHPPPPSHPSTSISHWELSSLSAFGLSSFSSYMHHRLP